jgi:hypothetical protein
VKESELKAIIAGIAPVIREQIAAGVRDETETLKSRIAGLEELKLSLLLRIETLEQRRG